MKRTNYLCVALLISTSFFSQQSKINIGFNAGPNYSFLYGNNYVKAISMPANYFSVGGTLQYNFLNGLALVTGIGFEKKGDRYEQQLYSGVLAKQYDIYNYLSVPLMLKASFGKKAKFFINAGGFGAFLISAQDKAVIVSTSQKDPASTTTKLATASYQRFDYGVSAGLGFTIPVSEKMTFSFEVRNYSGLYDIGKNLITKPFKTNATSLLLGLVFNIDKPKASIIK